MDLLLRMNQKLDIGWKMTNSSCEKCNGVTLIDINNTSEYFCPKCDKIYQWSEETIIDDGSNQPIQSSSKQQDNDDQQEYFNSIIQQSGLFKKSVEQKPILQQIPSKQLDPSPIYNSNNYEKIEKKTNLVSKKIGQKLLQGWTMLEQCCMNCNVPLMKSKKGEKICFGCEKDYSKIETKAVETKKPENSQIISQPQKIDQQHQKSSNSTINLQSQSIKSSLASNICTRIQEKALLFLEKRLDNSIQKDDLSDIQHIIQILNLIKK